MPKPTMLSDVLKVARFDWRDSIRSRRALILLAMYVIGATLLAYVFIQGLETFENRAASQFHLDAGEKPGKLTREILSSPNPMLRGLLENFVENTNTLDFLLSLPPLALFYGYIAGGLVPLFVILTGPESSAHAIESSSIRFSLFRVPRLHWALGKLFGQFLMMLSGVLLAGLAVWLIGFFSMGSFGPWENLAYLLRFSAVAAIASLPFLGIACAAGLVTRTKNRARALALAGWLGLLISSGLLQSDWFNERAPEVSNFLTFLVPSKYDGGLWSPDLSQVAYSTALLMVLAALYYSVGCLHFLRRDL